GGGAGGHAAARVHGDSERRAHGRGVLGHHHPELELVQALAGHRHADQAPPVGRHEVHAFRRDLVGGHDQIALVFTILVVDDQQHPALPDLLDAFLDRGEGHDVPLSASDRCRYLPITSVSMFTAWPSASPPKVVTASVCGITITSNVCVPSSAIVRLTPST